MANLVGGSAALAQTLFAGFAFAGAGTLMHYLEPNAYAEESERHNRALEKLAIAKEKCYENQVERKNKIQELRQQLSDANADINDTNHALDLLAKVGKTFPRESSVGDYYKPSDKMKQYQYVVVGVTGLAGGYMMHRFLTGPTGLKPGWCFPCELNKLRTHYGFACPKCGEAEFLCDAVPFVENIWLKQRSRHSRMRWLEKMLRDKGVTWNAIQVICGDFRKILQVFMNKGLIKGRNLSRYDYFVIRIVSRNKLSNVCADGSLRDLKKGRVKDAFDSKLFGVVYPELGWDKQCKCPYFLEWSANHFIIP